MFHLAALQKLNAVSKVVFLVAVKRLYKFIVYLLILPRRLVGPVLVSPAIENAKYVRCRQPRSGQKMSKV